MQQPIRETYLTNSKIQEVKVDLNDLNQGQNIGRPKAAVDHGMQTTDITKTTTVKQQMSILFYFINIRDTSRVTKRWIYMQLKLHPSPNFFGHRPMSTNGTPETRC
jgi:hypothetical protein